MCHPLAPFQTRLFASQICAFSIKTIRQFSTAKLDKEAPPYSKSSTNKPALQRLSSTHLIRNVILGSVFVNATLFRISMKTLTYVADPYRRLFYPESNFIVRWILRKPLYDHFCAGTTSKEVSTTVVNMKAAGYSGVILIPTREIMDGMSEKGSQSKEKADLEERANIVAWKNAHLETLKMIGANDYMGLKFTGAGRTIFARLAKREEPPEELLQAVDEICNQARQQHSRIWFDAEQQIIQPTIDRWVLELMRRYNKTSPLISNTYQAYLKNSPSVLQSHVRTAQDEGWVLGIKLVRGAYLLSEVRSKIHDTKADTDDCYDMLASKLITRELDGFKMGGPDVHVFIAGHNTISIQKTSTLYKDTVEAGRRYSPTRWGQLQGMADEVSCELLDLRGGGTSPEVYKCLQWGSVGESMQFLLRRATENHGAAHRMAGSIKVMREELFRRFFGA